jgi:hypothetical protein
MKGVPPGQSYLIRALRGDDTRFILISPRTVTKSDSLEPSSSSAR